MANLFNLGPDSMLLVYGVAVSLCAALLAWRHVRLAVAVTTMLAVAIALWITQYVLLGGQGHVFIGASFIVVPTVILLGASRVQWIARHAWVLLLAGPVVFAGCYGGICTLCYRAGLI